MGGYNTISEILSLEKKALIIPRVYPRREQLIRAELFEKLGLFDMFHPHEVTPELINSWLQHDVVPSQSASELIDFGGLKRIPSLLNNLSITTVAAGIRPTRKTSLDFVYHNYRQNEASTFVRDWEIDEDPNEHSTDIGYEIDLIAGYRFKPHHKGSFIVGYFNPGNAFRDKADDALFVELELQYEF